MKVLFNSCGHSGNAKHYLESRVKPYLLNTLRRQEIYPPILDSGYFLFSPFTQIKNSGNDIKTKIISSTTSYSSTLYDTSQQNGAIHLALFLLYEERDLIMVVLAPPFLLGKIFYQVQLKIVSPVLLK